MDIYIADAFTQTRFGGNAAGVVPLGTGDFPSESFMLKLAGELKHSETAFVREEGGGRFTLRYFTPAAEVELCGHATVAAFFVLHKEYGLPLGDHTALTKAGALRITVEDTAVWLDMAPGRVIKTLSPEEALPVYRSLGLDESDVSAGLPACIVSTGLSDVMLPVKSTARLNAAVLQPAALTALSRAFDVCGAHAFSLDDPAFTAHCRNFAPLYNIDEEAATGTANGALTHYLVSRGVICAGGEQRFLQGEAMGRPSVVLSRTDEQGRIRIGGSAAVCFKGSLC